MVRLIAALALIAGVSAQVQQAAFAPASKALNLKTSGVVHVLPTLNVAKSAAPPSLTKDREGGEEFGLNQFIRAGNNKIGEWTQVSAKEWVWTYTVQSQGARAMLPVFSKVDSFPASASCHH
jgi:hypothetical protein